MSKLSWEEFADRHGSGIFLVAYPPVLPKSLRDSLRRGGEALPTPLEALKHALLELLHGDWAVRTQHELSASPSRSYRKGLQHKQVIQLKLADLHDLVRIKGLICTRITAVRSPKSMAFLYDRASFFRLARLN